MGEKYLNDTRIYRTDKPFFIDKMPNNFRHIGLIHLMLPNARIIDARREPMACCFSNFKQLFASGQEFTYSLEDIARYYRTYLELMNHWNAVLPGRILKIDHEDIVEDLDANVRRILDFCGLEFESACLDFHKTERSVRTASSEQVRQPIFREGLDQWKNFEPWLAPLKTALGDALERYRNSTPRYGSQMTDPILLTPGPLTTSTRDQGSDALGLGLVGRRVQRHDRIGVPRSCSPSCTRRPITSACRCRAAAPSRSRRRWARSYPSTARCWCRTMAPTASASCGSSST